MQHLYEQIKDSTAEILALWDEAVQKEPWMHLPKPERTDHLPIMIETLADSCLARPQEVEAHRRSVAAAATHGEHRRLHGFAEAVVLEEYQYLREVLWRFIKTREAELKLRLEAGMRLEAGATLSTRAALLGYHRQELEAQGKWPRILDELAETSPFLSVGS